MISLDELKASDKYKQANPADQAAMEAYANYRNTQEQGKPQEMSTSELVKQNPLVDLAQAFFGDTPTQQAITGSTIAMDALRMAGKLPAGPWGRMLMLAGPTVAGGITEAIQSAQRGESPSIGATTGMIEGATTSAIPFAVGWRQSAKYGHKADREGLVDFVKKNLPSLASVAETERPGQQVPRLAALLRDGGGIKIAGDNLRRVRTDVAAAVQGQRFRIPALEASGIVEPEPVRFGRVGLEGAQAADFLEKSGVPRTFSFEEAQNLIPELWDRGTTGYIHPKTGKPASTFRRLYHEAQDQLISQLPAELQDQYRAANREFATVKLLRDEVFAHKEGRGALQKGYVNLQPIQSRIMDPDVSDALDRLPAGQDFKRWVNRDRSIGPLKAGTDVDVHGQFNPRVWAHLTGMPGVSGHVALPHHAGRPAETPFPWQTFLLGPTRLLGGALFNPGKAEAQQWLADDIRAGRTAPLGTLQRLANDPEAGLTASQRRRLQEILPPTPLPAAPSVR